MSRNPVIGMLFATMLEAKPFIDGLTLMPLENTPFPIYTNGYYSLIISGIGKTNAAMACTYFIVTYHPGSIINLGAAGATRDRYRLGESYHIVKVIEPDRLHLSTASPYVYIPDIMDGLEGLVLATHDKPVIDPQERKTVAAQVVDMEGAPVVQVCRHFKTMCYLFKFVTDTPKYSESAHIRDNIKRYGRLFYTFFYNQVLPRLEN